MAADLPTANRVCGRLGNQASAPAHSCSLVEVVGAVNDVGAKALGEAVDCHLQLALPSKGTEKVELHKIVDVDEVVGDETDQAERTWVVNVIKKSDPNCIKSLGNVGRFTEPVLTA